MAQFLVQEYFRLYENEGKSNKLNCSNNSATTQQQIQDEDIEDRQENAVLVHSAQTVILNLFAEWMMMTETEDTNTVLLRLWFGNNSNDSSGIQMIQCLVYQLTLIVESVLQQKPKQQQQGDGSSNNNNDNKNNKPKRPGEQQDHQQALLTCMVRFLGNLCYRCRINQDLLRELSVPPPPQPATTTTPNNTAATSAADVVVDRKILHVLLSCTSFSFWCFTLREWAVVAIRNALDINPSNQAFVAELEAQQPIQTTPLHDMGLQVEFNPRRPHGIKVVPLQQKQQQQDQLSSITEDDTSNDKKE